MTDKQSPTARHEFSLRSLGLPPPDDLKHLPLVGRDPTYPVPFIPEPARGMEDVPNIVSINVIPKIPGAEEQLRKLSLANELSSHYFSVKAAEAADVQIKAGALSTDVKPLAQTQRSNYRAKVTDYAINRTVWFRNEHNQDYKESWEVDKADFHQSLLDTILRGLRIPRSAYPDFEPVLFGICKVAQLTQNLTVALTNWFLIFTYEYDPIQKKVTASQRTVYYEINQSIYDYASNKSHTTRVHVDLTYKQNDFVLTESIWDSFKDEVLSVIKYDGLTQQPIVILV